PERREHASTVLLRGLDSLAPYLAGYLPALILTLTVTPTVVLVIAVTDWPSALVILITLPLIPLFMVLIGLMTRDRTDRKL
ncbi:thiol reductant ABC exporter subunit CydD, partial [Streptomyces sp. SID10244]|nr:thiol reductant ABC exporter subunit CydD [Streptomyces sp. SID10244]